MVFGTKIKVLLQQQTEKHTENYGFCFSLSVQHYLDILFTAFGIAYSF